MGVSGTECCVRHLLNRMSANCSYHALRHLIVYQELISEPQRIVEYSQDVPGNARELLTELASKSCSLERIAFRSPFVWTGSTDAVGLLTWQMQQQLLNVSSALRRALCGNTSTDAVTTKGLTDITAHYVSF